MPTNSSHSVATFIQVTRRRPLLIRRPIHAYPIFVLGLFQGECELYGERAIVHRTRCSKAPLWHLPHPVPVPSLSSISCSVRASWVIGLCYHVVIFSMNSLMATITPESRSRSFFSNSRQPQLQSPYDIHEALSSTTPDDCRISGCHQVTHS